jgi:hypothetical protein
MSHARPEEVEAMTITCATCGRDSGVGEDALAKQVPDGEVYAVLERDGWHLAVPRLGEPFRWGCDACWPEEASGHA